ncbi:MAG: hypothetical protein ACKOW2_00815 [Sphingobacteriaceae bacterium]
MGKLKNFDRIVQATPEGRLYISDADFFKQDEVVNTINALMQSSIYKRIVSGKMPKRKK